MPGNVKISGVSAAEPLVTQEVLAKYLGIPETTLEQWRSRGGGPDYVKVGARHVRYRLSEVNAWMDDERAARKGLASTGDGRS